MPDVLSPPSFGPDDILSMTHQPEAPNPVPGIVKPAMDFMTSGDMTPSHLPGTEPKDYLREVLQNPEIMAKNIEQASQFNFGGVTKGTPTMAAMRNFSPELEKGIQAGKSINQISRETGIPYNTLQYQAKQLGLQSKHQRYGEGPSFWDDPSKDIALKKGLSEGKTYEQLAGELGTTRSAIAGRVGRTRYLITSPDGKKYILAYHGSPHDFEKFDFSKIGTGEGAQAYGYGGYFAENEGVAKQYKKDLTGGRNSAAQRELDKAGGDVDAAMAAVKAEISRLKGLQLTPGSGAYKRDSMVNMNEEKLRDLSSFKASGQMNPGRMYQVGINADPEQFLDYDRPFNEQPQRIKEAIWRAGSGTKGHVQIQMDAVLKDLGDDVRHKLMTANADKFARKEMTQAEYNKANQTLWNMRDDVLASNALRQAGIPGIKYLDQGSRVNQESVDALEKVLKYAKSQGNVDAVEKIEAQLTKAKNPTRNYVVFDDKLIDIIKKYGWAGLGLPALGAGGEGDKQ